MAYFNSLLFFGLSGISAVFPVIRVFPVNLGGKKTLHAILFFVVTFNSKMRCLFCVNSGKTMSEYFKNLSKTAKRRYEEKLKDIGIENVEKG